MKTKYLLILLLLLVFNGCSKDETPPTVPPQPPPPDYRKMILSVEDISYTEAWINIKTDSINFPATITLLKNTNEEKFVLLNSDTTVYVDSLQPNVNYTFQAVLTGDTIKSDTVKAKTLEPTSHNFSWQTWEFGTHSSSALYDVAIIDENNIWAVGQIYMNDSLGNPDPHAYNAVHWDGNQWNILKITVDFRGSLVTPPLTGIYTFSETDIWFVGSLPIHGDGISWQMYDLRTTVDPNLSLSKVWGFSSENIYFTGGAGNLAQYDNGTWYSLQSGTDLDLTDIYGDGDGNIYAAGVNITEIKGVVVKGDQSGNWSVMIEGDIIDESELFDKLFGALNAIWVDEDNVIYAGGHLLYQYEDGEWDYVKSLPGNYMGGNPEAFYSGYIGSVRGNAGNDWIIAGNRNTLKHFNGADWEQLGLPYDPNSDIRWSKVEIKGDLAVAVGAKGIHSFIIILNR
jgi:hypothetical protein